MPPWRGRHFIVVQVFGTFVERDQGRLERLDGEVGLAFLVLTYLIVRVQHVEKRCHRWCPLAIKLRLL